MNRWMHGVVAGSIIALAPAVAAAPTADYEVSIGTEFAVSAPIGVNFGGKKPKVRAIFVGDNPVAKGDPKLKLKVRVNDSAGVALTVKKAKGAGTFDLEVTPRGREPVIVGTIETLLPQPNSTSIEVISPKGDFVISGSFFGTKKPKVRIGGKKAKTLDFSDTEIRVRVHKKTPAGAADIVVQNKIGSATLTDAIMIAGDGGGGPGNGTFVRAALASDVQALLTDQFSTEGKDPEVAKAFSRSSPDGPVTIVTAGMAVSGEVVTFSMSFRFDPGITPTPFTIDMNDADTGFNIAASQSAPDVSWYEGDHVPGTLTVTTATANRIAGTFSFTVPPGTVDPAASALEMTNGEFNVPVEGN